MEIGEKGSQSVLFRDEKLKRLERARKKDKGVVGEEEIRKEDHRKIQSSRIKRKS